MTPKSTPIAISLQYLAGMGSSGHRAGQIYENMTRNQSYPENLFVGSEEAKDALREAMLAYEMNR
jgi:hypothetical protein